MAKFKVGDRVSITRIDSADEGLGLRVGQIGKVVSICETSRNFGTVYVDLNEELPEMHPVVSDGRWRAYENQLQLAARVGPANVAEAIALYTAACEQFEAAEIALEEAKAAVQDARLNLGHWFTDGEVGSIMSGNKQVCSFGDDTLYEERSGEAPDQMDLVLIMAAPEMFAAIEQFEAWWPEVGQVSFNGAPACVFALREAAAKARGGV